MKHYFTTLLNTFLMVVCSLLLHFFVVGMCNVYCNNSFKILIKNPQTNIFYLHEISGKWHECAHKIALILCYPNWMHQLQKLLLRQNKSNGKMLLTALSSLSPCLVNEYRGRWVFKFFQHILLSFLCHIQWATWPMFILCAASSISRTQFS